MPPTGRDQPWLRRRSLVVAARVGIILGLLIPIGWDEIQPRALRESAAAAARNDPRTALGLALAHLGWHPWSRAAALAAARSFSQLDFAAWAEPYYRRVGLNQVDVADLQIRALGLFRANRRDEAVAAYQEILARHPDDVLALRRLAAVRIAQGAAAEALALAERLTLLPDGEVVGHTLAGTIYHDVGDTEHAVARWTKVLALDPTLSKMPLTPRSMFWSYLGQDLLTLGRADEVRSHLERALTAGPNAGLAALLASANRQLGNLDEAERWWRLASQWDPRLAGPWLGLGRLALQRGHLRPGDRAPPPRRRAEPGRLGTDLQPQPRPAPARQRRRSRPPPPAGRAVADPWGSDHRHHEHGTGAAAIDHSHVPPELTPVLTQLIPLRSGSKTSWAAARRVGCAALLAIPVGGGCTPAGSEGSLTPIVATAVSRGSVTPPPPPQPTPAGTARRSDPSAGGKVAAEAPSIRFRDASESAGITFVHCSGNSPAKHFPTANGSGVAMFDYDGDGTLDLYFATTRNLPLDAPNASGGNQLYRGRGDGTFEDVTERAGVGDRGFTHGVAVGDVDNNGHPDLYLAGLGGNRLYLNNGDGTFRRAGVGMGAECGTWSSGAAFLDYDADGDLDLYVSCYGKWTLDGERPFCGDPEKLVRTYCSPQTIIPERHFLFRNRGDGTFEDVTAAAGILRADGRGLGVLACDVDRDGRIDLYVANDLSPHFLFLNRGDGTFEDVSEASGASASESGRLQAGMGVDAEDVDGDGQPELLATHFREDYNTLYRNIDGRNFQDISAWAGIVKDCLPNVGWGCSLGDFDNDGWPDMMVVNGHVDDNLVQIGRDIPQAEPSRVWRNRGKGRFRLVLDAGPFFAADHVARGAAFGDLDNDGDLDAVVVRLDGPPAILLNESAPRPWIRLELLTGRSRRPAIGAMVAVHAGDRVLHRQVKGGGSYLSVNDSRLLVGLGAAERVDRVEIRWPGGGHTTLDAPEIRRTHQILEPEATPR